MRSRSSDNFFLTSFDDFAGNEILSERDLQDYLGRYQDLRDEWKNRRPAGEKEDITDDIVFEIELIKQIDQTTDQVRCEPFKTTAKFQWFWIFYTLILFLSYT